MKKQNLELTVFETKIYGDYGCSKCGKPLFDCIAVGETGDDDGHEWRSFHKECFEQIPLTAEEIYEAYGASEYLDK